MYFFFFLFFFSMNKKKKKKKKNKIQFLQTTLKYKNDCIVKYEAKVKKYAKCLSATYQLLFSDHTINNNVNHHIYDTYLSSQNHSDKGHLFTLESESLGTPVTTAN